MNFVRDLFIDIEEIFTYHCNVFQIVYDFFLFQSRAKQSKLQRKSASITAKVNKVTSANTSKTDESAAEATESADSVYVPTDKLAVQSLLKVESKGAEVS